MLCLRCDGEEFEAGNAQVDQEYKGMSLKVDSPVMLCKNCGWFTCSLEQADVLRRRTNDLYEFEVWFAENYAHVDPDQYGGTLAKNVITMTKVIARTTWMAAREPKTPDAGT
jgi:hypothetical protein